MATGESLDDGTDESQPAVPRAGFLARLLWGVDAPTTGVERERRWARAARDVGAIWRAFR